MKKLSFIILLLFLSNAFSAFSQTNNRIFINELNGKVHETLILYESDGVFVYKYHGNNSSVSSYGFWSETKDGIELEDFYSDNKYLEYEDYQGLNFARLKVINVQGFGDYSIHLVSGVDTTVIYNTPHIEVYSSDFDYVLIEHSNLMRPFALNLSDNWNSVTVRIPVYFLFLSHRLILRNGQIPSILGEGYLTEIR